MVHSSWLVLAVVVTVLALEVTEAAKPKPCKKKYKDEFGYCPACTCEECMDSEDGKPGACFRKKPKKMKCDCRICQTLDCQPEPEPCNCYPMCGCECKGSYASTYSSAHSASFANTFSLSSAAAVANMSSEASANAQALDYIADKIRDVSKAEVNISVSVKTAAYVIAEAFSNQTCRCHHDLMSKAAAEAYACARATATSHATAAAASRAWATASAKATAHAKAVAKATAKAKACAKAAAKASSSASSGAAVTIEAGCDSATAESKAWAKTAAAAESWTKTCAKAVAKTKAKAKAHAKAIAVIAVEVASQVKVMVDAAAKAESCARAVADTIATCTDECTRPDWQCEEINGCIFSDLVVDMDIMDENPVNINIYGQFGESED